VCTLGTRDQRGVHCEVTECTVIDPIQTRRFYPNSLDRTTVCYRADTHRKNQSRRYESQRARWPPERGRSGLTDGHECLQHKGYGHGWYQGLLFGYLLGVLQGLGGEGRRQSGRRSRRGVAFCNLR